MLQVVEYVEIHMTEAAHMHHQQQSCNQCVQQRRFQVGDAVWLALPTAGKFQAIQGPTSYMV